MTAAETTTAMAQEAPAFDPVRIAGLRAWKSAERTELMAALARHASRDGIRYNLTCVNVEGGHAWATDGHRALFVSSVAGKTPDGSFAVTGGRMTIEQLETTPPDLRRIVTAESMQIPSRTYELRRFSRVKKLRAALPVCLTDDGLSLGGRGAGVAVNLKFIADLPSTDETLRFHVRGDTKPVIVVPALGGWLAVIMPVRVHSEDAFFAQGAA